MKKICFVIVLLALLIPLGGVAQAQEPGMMHYVVFRLEVDGSVVPVFYRQVVGSAPSSLAEIPPGRDGMLQANLEDESGQVIFRTMVSLDPLHGEFPDEVGNLQYIEVDQWPKSFVIRAPVIENAKWLHLIGKNVDARYDLVELASRQDLTAQEVEAQVIADPTNGPISNRINLVFVAEGFRAEEQSVFMANAQYLRDNMFNVSPYNRYKSYFNFFYLFLESIQSGADHPLPCFNPPVMVDTILNASYCNSGNQVLLGVDPAKLDQVLWPALSQVPDWHQAMIIVNDQEYGGSGPRPLSVVSLHSEIIWIAQHEWAGHGAGLADTYRQYMSRYCSDTGIEGFPPCPANVTDNMDHDSAKWSRWYQSDPLIGLFPFEDWLNRSSEWSLMNSLYHGFNAVEQEAIILWIYRGDMRPPGWTFNRPPLLLIDSVSPVGGSVSVASIGMPLEFSVDTLDPIGEPAIEYRWLVDGQEVASGTTTYTFTPTMTQTYTLEVKVADQTQLVHPSVVRSGLTASHTWQVNVGSRAGRIYLPVVCK